MELLRPRDLRRVHAYGHREAQGEPPEPHREDHERHEAEPKRRHRRERVAHAADRPVGAAPPPRAGEHPEREAEDTREQPGGRHKGSRVREALAHDLHDRAPEAQALAKVPAKRRGGPVCVARGKGRRRAPVLGELGALRLAHLRVGGLAEVRLHRVYRRGCHQGKRRHARGDKQQGEPCRPARPARQAADGGDGRAHAGESAHATPSSSGRRCSRSTSRGRGAGASGGRP